jgi:hypothetical protein
MKKLLTKRNVIITVAIISAIIGGVVVTTNQPVQLMAINSPANPNASQQARQVLNYFYGLQNSTSNIDQVLTGQFAGFIDSGNFASNYNTNIQGVFTKTGEYPAMMVASYGYWSKEIDSKIAIDRANPIIIDYWNKGGLIGIMPHYRNPLCATTNSAYSPSWGCGDQVQPIVGELKDIMDPTKQAYTIMRNEMDRVAYGLQKLEDAGVVVLWRPFHEMNFGWYWYGIRDQAQYVALWRYEFDYLTRVKGLSNLLYVFGPNYQESWTTLPRNSPTYFYPGDAYVDVMGLSMYDVDPSQLNSKGGWDAVRSINKPRGVYEFGPPNNSSYNYSGLMTILKNTYPDAVFWGHWSEGWGLVSNPNPSIVMGDAYSITRDEVVLGAVVTVTPVSATATRTPTPNAPTSTSVQPSKTPTPVFTVQTPTKSRTPTLTVTFTPTKTATLTPSATPTATQTASSTSTFTATASPVPPIIVPTHTPTATPDAMVCVRVTWDRGLNMRPGSSMHNASYDYQHFGKGAEFPVEAIIEDGEGTWMQINEWIFAAMYLKSNGQTYAVVVECK